MKGGAKVRRPAKIANARPAAKIARGEPATQPAKTRSAKTRKSAQAESAKVATRAKPASENRASAKPASAAVSLAPGGAVRSIVAAPVATSSPAAGSTVPEGARDEMLAIRDVGRLLHYGEHLGTDTIDIRMLPLQLHIASGSLAVFDPGAPDTWHVLDRPIGRGAFRVMLSVARPDASADPAAERGRERLAAVAIHAGRPPIARWTVAHFRGQGRPTSGDALPRTVATTGWIALLDAGDGPPGVLALPPATGLAPIEVPLTDGRRAIALPCHRG